MAYTRGNVVEGWLFTSGALLVGVLILIDPVRFVSSPAWQNAIHSTPGGRPVLGALIFAISIAMAATLIAVRWIWAPFIAGGLWFTWVSLILIKTTFTTTGGGTPGFVVWAIFGAAALMNYGVEHIPDRT